MTALVGSYVEDFKGMAVKATQFQNASGSEITFTPNAGTTTDNAIARFDSTAGAIQNSVVTIADTSGNIAGAGTIACGAITTTGALTVTGAVNSVFNSSALDADFTVNALTSGVGLKYDSGADTLVLGKTATAVTVNGGVTFADGTTDVDIASHDATNGLKLGGVLVAATAAEINQSVDLSTRYIAAGSTLSATLALHNGKVIKLDTASGSVVTLPAASGTGARFRFVISVLATSNSHVIKVANSSDTMQGMIFTVDDTSDNAQGFIAVAGTSDTITLNRSTFGSVSKGEWFELEDFAANVWQVRGFMTNTGTAATPFSATV